MAQRLLHKAEQTPELPSRYALLKEAASWAVKAGDAETAGQALDAMAADFAADTFDLKMKMVNGIRKAGVVPRDCEALVAIVMPLIEEAVAKDQFDAAGQLQTMAEELAVKAKDKDLLKQVRGRNKEFRKEAAELKKAHAAVEEAMAVLQREPADPEANLTVGKYTCFAKGQWSKGLPLLALGNDARPEGPCSEGHQGRGGGRRPGQAGRWLVGPGRAGGRGGAKKRLRARANAGTRRPCPGCPDCCRARWRSGSPNWQRRRTPGAICPPNRAKWARRRPIRPQSAAPTAKAGRSKTFPSRRGYWSASPWRWTTPAR